MKYSTNELYMAIAMLANRMLPDMFLQPAEDASADEKNAYDLRFKAGSECLHELSCCLVDPNRSTDKLDEMSQSTDIHWLMDHDEFGNVTVGFGFGGFGTGPGGEDEHHEETVNFHLMEEAKEELEGMLEEL